MMFKVYTGTEPHSPAYELQEHSSTFYTPQNVPTLLAWLKMLTKDVRRCSRARDRGEPYPWWKEF